MSVASNGGQILGKAKIDGPCDKDAKGMNGATCGLSGARTDRADVRARARSLPGTEAQSRRQLPHRDGCAEQPDGAVSLRHEHAQLCPADEQPGQQHARSLFDEERLLIGRPSTRRAL